uniref:Peptide/nickel transport system ATP-binding protein n=1 Tax=Candidatus Kentrum sp. FW TaxID=2126338 RepID=A0A450T358_9GAMM|nr:MAG: peptide/nickel transport system ATP-binding protein [Candidatus Kentron sp. FW]VFJ62014.1 MAG: peptide/nickel transport system ATP-binding protein [Candidatus Kentron sp. FW]
MLIDTHETSGRLKIMRSVPGSDVAPNTWIEIKDLTCHFDVSPPWLDRLLERKERALIRAVDGLDLTICRGETFSLVGESGCGKSTVARLIAGIHRPTQGTIHFPRGHTVSPSDSSNKTCKGIRPRMQMIFQDPYASLNPRWRVRDIVAEPIRVRCRLPRRRINERVTILLEQVGLRAKDGNKYPHEFSGGQRQRISIARALAGEPEFLICDEPTSALDVSVQAQILNLMKILQKRLGLTYLFISHDLAVVYHISTRVGVMYLGRLVEWGDTKTLFQVPRHPYTKMLLDAIPNPEMGTERRKPVDGEPPNPTHPPSGCAFHPRCPHTRMRCRTQRPVPIPIGSTQVACHAVEERRI